MLILRQRSHSAPTVEDVVVTDVSLSQFFKTCSGVSQQALEQTKGCSGSRDKNSSGAAPTCACRSFGHVNCGHSRYIFSQIGTWWCSPNEVARWAGRHVVLVITVRMYLKNIRGIDRARKCVVQRLSRRSALRLPLCEGHRAIILIVMTGCGQLRDGDVLHLIWTTHWILK